MDTEYRRLADTILSQSQSSSSKRYLVAIAGIPGSGKTTTAQALVSYLNTNTNTHSALLSMDGFHLPRSTLDSLPNATEAYIRRGAPWTFDVSRFVSSIRELRLWANETPLLSSWTESQIIRAPAFDHEAKDPVEDGIAITPNTSIIIIEGNYLLLDEPGWREVVDLVDYRVFVDTDLEEARERTARRHVEAGIETCLEDGYRRVDRNDYLNGVCIRERLLAPDLVVKSVSIV